MRTLHHYVSSGGCCLTVVCRDASRRSAGGKNGSHANALQDCGNTAAQEQQYAQPTLAPETQSVHVQVGRSIILNTQARLRRIVVSNPNVLDTATVSPTQVVVTAKAPGSSSVWCCGISQTRASSMYTPMSTFPV